MKNCTVIILFLFIQIPLFSQFPLFDGKETSGIFAISYTGSDNIAAVLPISYNISKSNLKVSFQKALKDLGVEPTEPNLDDLQEPQFWVPYKLRSFEFSISLKDFNFDIGSISDFDINLSTIAVGKRFNTGKRGYIPNNPNYVLTRSFINYSVKPSFLFSKKSNYLKQVGIDTFSVENVSNFQLGLSSSMGLQIEKDGSPEWAIGLNLYLGYSFNDFRDLSNRQLCIESRIGTVGSNNATIDNCSEVLAGQISNTSEAVTSLDFSKRLFGPFKSAPKEGTNEKLARFNNPSIHLLSRLQLNIKEKSTPKYKVFFGLSLARVDRQIYASFLIDLLNAFGKEDDEQDKFVETSNVSATISIPLSAGN